MNDKSLFKFVSPNKRIVLATLHSDDVDLVCEDPNDGVAIADAFNTRFGPSTRIYAPRGCPESPQPGPSN